MTKFRELIGSESDNYYKKFTLPGWSECSSEEILKYGVYKKRDKSKHKSLFLVKVNTGDSKKPFFAVSDKSALLDLCGESKDSLIFSDEVSAVNYIKNQLTNECKTNLSLNDSD